MQNWTTKLLATAAALLLAPLAYAQSSRATSPEPKTDPDKTGTSYGTARTEAGSAEANIPSPRTTSSRNTASGSERGEPGKSGTASSARASASRSTVQAGEQEFLARLAQDNQSEIDMAKLANDNSSSPRVKSFAEQLIRDHENAGDQVKDFAKKKNIDLKASSAKKDHDKAEMDRLKSVKGADFDKQFLRQMATDHQKTIKDVTAARTRFKDPELRGLLDKQLPTLKQHLASAKDLEKSGAKARAAPPKR